MVNERNTVHPECSRTFRNYNFFVDVTRDYMRCPYCYRVIYPDSAKGRFDVVAGYPVARGEMYWCAIEVKYGGKTNLPFNKISKSQRDWYDKHIDDYDMWLWFCIGDRINSEQHPRRTWLIPFSLFLELQNNLKRKSISPDCEEIKPYELLWEGGGFWSIPAKHALWRNALLE